MDDFDNFFKKFDDLNYKLKNKNHSFYYLYKFFGWLISTPVIVFRFLWFLIWKPMDNRAKRFIPHNSYRITMLKVRLFQIFIILCAIFSVIVIIVVAVYLLLRINFSPF